MRSSWFFTAAITAFAAACAPSADNSGQEAAPEIEAAEAMGDPSPAASDESALAGADVASALEAVLAHERRDEDRARDMWRNPSETLAFFEVEPSHSVVEALPGGGWYGRIIAPYVAEEGAYMAVNYPMEVYDQIFGDRLTDERRATLAAWEEAFPVQAAEWGGEASAAFRFGGVPAELEGQADRVLYIRALHNMARFDRLGETAEDAFTLLRPGGVVGVVQHRAPADEADDRATGSRGYLREADVVAAFEAAGFVLEDSSEINANPNDPADHEIGVWVLPPTLGLGDQDRDRYAGIGETDRMTLKFIKPA